MKKVKGLVVLGSFIFINSLGFAVTDAEFRQLKKHYENFGNNMATWSQTASGQINTLNTNVTNLNNQVTNINKEITDLNKFKDVVDRNMSIINTHVVLKDGTNLNPTDFRKNLDVYSKTEVNNSLNGKANASDVADLKEQVSNLNQTMTTVNGKADANNVYTKAEVDNTLNGKADANNVYTKAEVDTSLGNKADKNDIYTKNEVDTSLDNKADKNDVHTKTEVNNLLGNKADSNNVYTKTEVDTSLGNKADKNSIYTKTEIDKLLISQNQGTGVSNVITNAATGKGSLAFGEGTTASGNYSTAVGYKNTVSGNNSGAFGDPNIVTGNGSYAFGNDNTINGNNNFVLGNNVTIGSSIQNSVALGNNSTVSSSNEVSVGSATQKRKITNVADGEISATSTDAVTGKQLYNAIQNSGAAGVENLRNDVYEKIDNVKSEVRTVGSLSAALAGLHPMQYDPKAPSQIMAAIGHYRDKQSVAVGLSYYFNNRFMVNTGVAISGEKRTKSMANIGFTLKLGKGSGVTYNETPQYIVQNEVKRLTAENQELKERVKNLEDKLNKVLESK